ncbi:HAD-IA family hydrolase [Planktotalea sp.]|uniref:HAD-IA family hydrolase n=1 Tax=Planktotalea sp. TaxID=2029877 RepID=UPI0025D79733|nr:HAD-IA family hydrolase [Planktotalea sp.]
MRTVIFDLDGTLADTSGDLLAAANTCFENLGMAVRLHPSTDAGVALRGGRAMLTRGIERETGQAPDPAVLDAQYKPLLDAYEKVIAVHTVLYPGVMAAIERLGANGIPVGICTNKPEYLAEILMTKLGVRDAFGSLIGADTLPVRKPDPEPFFEAVRRLCGDPKRACLIGDTITDHNTARAAGVPSVLVTFGPGAAAGQADIRALEPDALLDHFDDLPDLIEKILPA